VGAAIGERAVVGAELHAVLANGAAVPRRPYKVTGERRCRWLGFRTARISARSNESELRNYAYTAAGACVSATRFLAALRTFSNARTSICRTRSRDTLNSTARSSNVIG